MTKSRRPIPAAEGATSQAEEELRVSPLSFELPAVIRGLEQIVYERTARIADPADVARFERVARMMASLLEHRVLGWLEPGRIPSETNSIPATLVAAGE